VIINCKEDGLLGLKEGGFLVYIDGICTQGSDLIYFPFPISQVSTFDFRLQLQYRPLLYYIIPTHCHDASYIDTKGSGR
jgi:hypothetical protein